MTDGGTWSPDDAPDNESFESWDEALDDQDALRPGSLGPEGERSLDTQLTLDRTEIDEAGVGLDDPERLAVLDGGIDDPDGTGEADDDDGPDGDADGWDLDAEERQTAHHLDDEDS